jgi:hypothetical protein
MPRNDGVRFVCSQAAEPCSRTWPGSRERLHWFFDDPLRRKERRNSSTADPLDARIERVFRCDERARRR